MCGTHVSLGGHLMSLLSNAIDKRNCEAFSENTEQILHSFTEAVIQGRIESKKEEIAQFKSEYEFLYNKLNISENENRMNAFYFGQITAVVFLCEHLCQNLSEKAEYEHIDHHNPLLRKCIEFIGNNNMVTSKQVISALKMTSRSSFGNLFDRQKNKGYIVAYKHGNKNIYMLSEKGRRYYYSNILLRNEPKNDGQEISRFATILANNIKKRNLNIFQLVTELAEQESMLPYYLSKEFTSKVNEIYEAIRFQNRLDVKEAISESMRNNRKLIRSSLELEYGILDKNSYTQRLEEMTCEYSSEDI